MLRGRVSPYLSTVTLHILSLSSGSWCQKSKFYFDDSFAARTEVTGLLSSPSQHMLNVKHLCAKGHDSIKKRKKKNENKQHRQSYRRCQVHLLSEERGREGFQKTPDGVFKHLKLSKAKSVS